MSEGQRAGKEIAHQAEDAATTVAIGAISHVRGAGCKPADEAHTVSYTACGIYAVQTSMVLSSYLYLFLHLMYHLSSTTASPAAD